METSNLYNPKKKKRNIKHDIKALKELTDQDAIAQILKKDDNRDIRIVAIRKLDIEKWQSLFADIAKNDQDGIIRGEALVRLKSDQWQDIISDIAITDEDEYNRLQAIEFLMNNDTLKNISENDFSFKVRVEAIKKIENQKYLADFAATNENPIIREITINKLEAKEWQDLLADIAKNDQDEVIRLLAVNKLDAEKWQELLAYIASNDESNQVSNAAKKKITTEKLIKQDKKFVKQSKALIKKHKKRPVIWLVSLPLIIFLVFISMNSSVIDAPISATIFMCLLTLVLVIFLFNGKKWAWHLWTIILGLSIFPFLVFFNEFSSDLGIHPLIIFIIYLFVIIATFLKSTRKFFNIHSLYKFRFKKNL